MRLCLIASVIAIVVGFVVRMEADDWSTRYEVVEGGTYGMTDAAKRTAFEQLSYCLMYGGTVVAVFCVMVPLVRGRVG